jgi:hypothetical protein
MANAKTRPEWTDEQLLQVLTAEGYIMRAENKEPEFVGLRPMIEEWWEARIRHAAATEPARLREARARLIRLARRIEQIKVEWAEGPQTPAAKARLASNHRSHGRVVALSPARRKASSSPSR